MKKIALAALVSLMVIPGYAAACSPTDFAISHFKMHATRAGNNVILKLSGTLTNNCTSPAGAQIEVSAKDKNGAVLAKRDGWPLGSSNVPAGASVEFNFGAVLPIDTRMKNFSAAIVSVRSW